MAGIMREADLMRAMQRWATDEGARLFRNNVGTGWAGQVERKTGLVYVGPNDVVVRDARPLHAGLFVGSGDLIGMVPVEVTPGMVGEKVAVFTSVEVKVGQGKASAAQRVWRDGVLHHGGRAGIARNEEDLRHILWGTKF